MGIGEVMGIGESTLLGSHATSPGDTLRFVVVLVGKLHHRKGLETAIDRSHVRGHLGFLGLPRSDVALTKLTDTCTTTSFQAVTVSLTVGVALAINVVDWGCTAPFPVACHAAHDDHPSTGYFVTL